jgi:hypothetical protein
MHHMPHMQHNFGMLFYSPTHWFSFYYGKSCTFDILSARIFCPRVCWIKYEIENYVLFCLSVVVDQLLFLEFSRYILNS